jgi:hypothetical protein
VARPNRSALSPIACARDLQRDVDETAAVALGDVVWLDLMLDEMARSGVHLDWQVTTNDALYIVT